MFGLASLPFDGNFMRVGSARITEYFQLMLPKVDIMLFLLLALSSCCLLQFSQGLEYSLVLRDFSDNYCDAPNIHDRHVEPATEEQCQTECATNWYKFAMWDYGKQDGFCMCSQLCARQKKAGGGRVYRVWEVVLSTEYGFTLMYPGGSYCYSPSMNNIYVNPAEEDQCKIKCFADGFTYAMWNQMWQNCRCAHVCDQIAVDFNYRTWQVRQSIQYRPIGLESNGSFCNSSSNSVRYVRPKSEEHCKTVCTTNGSKFAAWDFGDSNDGFCMCSRECDNKIESRAADDRHFRIWEQMFVVYKRNADCYIDDRFEYFNRYNVSEELCLGWCRSRNENYEFCLWSSSKQICTATTSCQNKNGSAALNVTIWQNLDLKSDGEAGLVQSSTNTRYSSFWLEFGGSGPTENIDGIHVETLANLRLHAFNKTYDIHNSTEGSVYQFAGLGYGDVIQTVGYRSFNNSNRRNIDVKLRRQPEVALLMKRFEVDGTFVRRGSYTYLWTEYAPCRDCLVYIAEVAKMVRSDWETTSELFVGFHEWFNADLYSYLDEIKDVEHPGNLHVFRHGAPLESIL